MGSDILYRNMENYSAQANSAGVIAVVTQSNITVDDMYIKYSTIGSNCRQSVATGAIIGFMQSVFSQISNVNVLNNTIGGYSLEQQVCTGGVNGKLSASNDYQFNVSIQKVGINSISTQNSSFISGQNGYARQSTVNLAKVTILAINISTNSRDTYCGGFLGLSSSCKIYLSTSQISSTRLTAQATVDCVIGSAIGFVTDNSNATIDCVKIMNVLNQLVAHRVFSGSFFGSVLTTVSSSQTIVANSEVYSVYINYAATISIASVLLSLQYPAVSSGYLSVANTKSLGFSSINGVLIGNCEAVIVQNISGNNYLSQTGC
ncbi:Hypothetical_protein [Hexamita inflata]|uniref:Hypothetical_protein n=1 Tax=Hexamita inflata TaxID=28002 RepID=A0AA86Q7E6_9EUKA|nr:Hypothetical protein HINF_LOCUS41464 [Hexamita inflata]